MTHETIDPSEVRSALAEMLASEQFRATKNRAAFLEYVVEQTLLGNASSIKGYNIGVDVLERSEDFDPQTDPIVRLEAGRLRRELEHYYLTDGRNAHLEIEIPKGTYVPVFKRRERISGPGAHEGGRSPTSDRAPRPYGKRDVKVQMRAALIGALIGACAIGGLAWIGHGVLHERSTGNKSAPTEPGADQATVAKLYVAEFYSMSDDPMSRALAHGLTQEITGVISKFREVEVYPVSNTFVDELLSNVGKSDPAAAKFLLSGSSQIVNQELNVYAVLRNAGDGRQIWSEEFQVAYEPAQVFGIQESIATTVARKLAEPYGILRETVRLDFSERYDPALENYNCVLLGYRYRQVFAQAEHLVARDCLESATAREPKYARAWAILTYLTVDEIRLFYNTKPDAGQRALKAANRAVELAPNDPLSFQALSVAEFTAGNIGNGLEAAQHAVDLNRHNYEALWQLGFRMWLSGNYEEGARIALRAIEESPTHPSWYYWVLVAEKYRLGDYEAARALSAKMARTKLVFIEGLRTMILGQLGMSEAAKESLEALRKLDPLFDTRARDWFATHQISDEMLDHFEDGLRKAGLEG